MANAISNFHIFYTSQKYDINVLVLPLCETRYELKKMWASIQPTFVFSLLLVGACNATAKKAGSSSPAHFSLKLMLKLMLTVTLMCKMYKATARYSTLGALISGWNKFSWVGWGGDVQDYSTSSITCTVLLHSWGRSSLADLSAALGPARSSDSVRQMAPTAPSSFLPFSP